METTIISKPLRKVPFKKDCYIEFLGYYFYAGETFRGTLFVPTQYIMDKNILKFEVVLCAKEEFGIDNNHSLSNHRVREKNVLLKLSKTFDVNPRDLTESYTVVKTNCGQTKYASYNFDFVVPTNFPASMQAKSKRFAANFRYIIEVFTIKEKISHIPPAIASQIHNHQQVYLKTSSIGRCGVRILNYIPIKSVLVSKKNKSTPSLKMEAQAEEVQRKRSTLYKKMNSPEKPTIKIPRKNDLFNPKMNWKISLSLDVLSQHAKIDHMEIKLIQKISVKNMKQNYYTWCFSDVLEKKKYYGKDFPISHHNENTNREFSVNFKVQLPPDFVPTYHGINNKVQVSHYLEINLIRKFFHVVNKNIFTIQVPVYLCHIKPATTLMHEIHGETQLRSPSKFDWKGYRGKKLNESAGNEIKSIRAC